MAGMGLDGEGHFEISGHGTIDVMPRKELDRLLEKARQQGIAEGRAMTLAEAGGEREEGMAKVREALGMGDVKCSQDTEVFKHIMRHCQAYEGVTKALDEVGEQDDPFTPEVEVFVETLCDAIGYTPRWARG